MVIPPPATTWLLGVALAFAPVRAQEPPAGAPSAAGYRAPSIALVQPPPGGTVPGDKPIVMLRFASGDAGDPIDARSFAITVDGQDRSRLFQVTATEAWGPLVPPNADGVLTLAPGAHRLAGRVCSIRGACAELVDIVIVVESDAVTPAAPADRKRSLVDLLLIALRKLIEP